MKHQSSLACAIALVGLLVLPACGSNSSSHSSSSGKGGTGGSAGAGGTSGPGAGGTGGTASGGASGTAGMMGGQAGAGGSSGTAGSGGGPGENIDAAAAKDAAPSRPEAGADAARDGAAVKATLTTEMTTKGTVLATGGGLTLYVYKPDTPGTGATAPVSACTGTCTTAWPPYYANPLTAPAGLAATDFGSFDRGAGKMQTTYKGWPLYTYHDDKKPGDIFGDGELNVWFAVKIPFTPPK